MATLKNVTSSPVSFKIAGKPGAQVKRYLVAPGETCVVDDGYCGLNGERSIISMIAPGLELFKVEKKAAPPTKTEVPAPVREKKQPAQSRNKKKSPRGRALRGLS